MLVLSRKSRESVVVGGADGFHHLLKVTVLGINGTKVKLGFEVDPEVPVHRYEVWERMGGNGGRSSLADGLTGASTGAEPQEAFRGGP
jgi:carbon storage regulator CsrA